MKKIPYARPVLRCLPILSLLPALLLAEPVSLAAQATPAGEHLDVRTPAAPPDEPMPEGLEIPGADPFSGGLVLRARKLRGLSAEVAGLILRSNPGGEIAAETLAVPLGRRGGDRVYVPVLVEIDGATFLNTNQASTARVEVYAYALGAEQGVAGYLAEAFAVDVQSLGEAIWQSGLKYHGHLELPAGDYRLRVLVRNFQSKASGLRESSLRVPEPGEFKKPLLLAPIFSAPDDRDAWLPVLEYGGRDTYEVAYPFMAGGRALQPVALPVLTAGRPAEAHLIGYGLSEAGRLQGRVELVAADGAKADSELEILSRPETGSQARETAKVRFETPHLAPGHYSLRVDLGEGRQKTSSPPINAVVLDAKTRDRSMMWTDLRGRLNTTEVQQKAEQIADTATGANERQRRLAQERAEKGRLRAEQRELGRLSLQYRDVLQGLGSGEVTVTRSHLLDLEAAVLTSSGGSAETLQRAQLQVAEQLAAVELEALIPILVLHQELYLTYRQRRLYSLSFHARSMIESLAELYASRGGSQGSGVVAARALVSLGGYLQEANLPSSSREIFERALVHDPLSKSAMLGLATSYERYGEYSKAIEVLERLAVAHPDLAECHLRLAIDLGRLGIRPRSRELLARVVELEAPSWVRSLAHQELARSLLETGSLDQAIDVLERTLAEFPEQSVLTMLAHAYDRRRQPHRSLELLQSVTPAPTRISPRKTYDGWPEAAFQEERAALAEAAASRTPLVVEILAAAEKEDEP